MSEFRELINKLQDLSLQQENMDWAECIPEDIWNEYIKGNFKQLKRGLRPEAHRWHEVSTSVIEIYGGLLGITHVSNLFSESMDVDACCHIIEFNEMKEIKTTSYKPVLDGQKYIRNSSK